MSFRLKTILGIALIEVILLIVLVTMSLGYLSDSNEKQLSYRANSIAQLFAKSVQDAVLSYDLATLDSLVQHLLTDPEIVYIRIANNDQVLAMGGDERLLNQDRTQDEHLSEVEDAVFDVEVNIGEAGQRYGTVALGLSTGVIDELIGEARRYMSSIALGEVLLVALFSLALGTYLTRQLRQLELASTSIIEHGPGHQIPVQGNDEIARTLRAFNDMSASLAMSSSESERTKEAYRQLAFIASSNEAIAKATLNACLDGIVTIDAKGHIVEYNGHAEQIFGWTRAEMIGTNMAERLIPATMRDQHNAGMAHYLATGEGPVLNKRLELPALDRNGEQITIEISIAPMTSQHEPLFTAFIRDISQQKEATEAIEQARLAADQANRAKSRFLATMSHEIRSPLNAVVNMNELLLESPLDEKQRELARIAHEGGLTLMSLINDILDFSRIESGKLLLNEHAMPIKQVVQSVVELHSGIAYRRGICLQAVIPPALDRQVLCDEMRFRQVITNLVSNALKFTHAGGVVLRAALDGDPGFFCVSVSDSGEGIPTSRHQEIFQEFHQLEDENSRRFAGSGLGLAITHRLVGLMGGDITVQSQPGLGSTFTVRLPLKEVPDAVAVTVDPPGCLDTDAVLLNIDNPVLRTALIDLCEAWGIPALTPEFEAARIQSDWRHFTMIVDADPNGEALPMHQLKARQIAPAGQWRYVTVAPLETGASTKAPGYAAVLRTPIRAESLIRFVCHQPCNSCIDQPRPIVANEQQRSGIRVLLVDDSDANQAVGRALLSRLGCNVETADDGQAAIELAARQRYDIIFMDLAMPRMDGIEATEIIRGQHGPNQATPIVALTANAFAEDRASCLSSGMDDFLAKPIDRAELQAIVTRYQTQKVEETVPRTSVESAPQPKPPSSDDAPELVDRETLQRLTRDTSPEAVREILSIYLGEVTQRIPDMLSQCQRGDIEALGSEAHALKSSSASFGAAHLAALARDIELAARESRLDDLEQLTADLATIADASVEALDRYREGLGDG
ncbi:MAG: response regulator [Gammaproteobacteria bacterium]|nr:response regulator [Gammaproteobacteria bacterium]